MEYRLSTIISKEGNLFVAKGLEIELASQGKTVEESLNNLKEAFELWIQHAEPSELAILERAKSPIVTQLEVVA